MKNYLSALLLFLFSAALIPSSFGQGSLNPPGPPAPTMKTLDQLDSRFDGVNAKVDEVLTKAEKRIPLSATTTPGDADTEFNISQPGSYYLTGNLNVTKDRGIRVAQPGVTIDLNGFEIRRTGGSGGVGIDVAAAANTCKVRNGSVVGFNTGIESDAAEACSFEQLRVSFCSFIGLRGGPASTIHQVEAVRNTVFGIIGGSGARITDCTAHLNGGTGIVASGLAVVVDRCVSTENGGDGIFAGEGSSVTRCTARSNGGSSGSGSGIVGGVRTKIEDCTANNNRGNGISVLRGSVVINNRAGGNGAAPGDFAGIRSRDPAAGATPSRIDGNYVEANDIGIFAGASDFVTRNTAAKNVDGSGGNANYDPFPGSPGPGGTTPNSAPIQPPASATNPFANFQSL